MQALQHERDLVLGEFDAALAAYDKAVNADPPPSPREVASMYQQATLVTTIVGGRSLATRLDRIFSGDAKRS